MNTAMLKDKKVGKPGYVKFSTDDYNLLIDLFNVLQRDSQKKLFLNRELLKSLKMRVKGEL